MIVLNVAKVLLCDYIGKDSLQPESGYNGDPESLEIRRSQQGAKQPQKPLSLGLVQ